MPEGKIVGDTLNHILDMVINGELENYIEEQMEEAKRFLEERNYGE